MVDTQIIEMEKSGWSGSASVSTNIIKRPSAFFFILDLLVRVLPNKSPILTGTYLNYFAYFVKGKILAE